MGRPAASVNWHPAPAIAAVLSRRKRVADILLHAGVAAYCAEATGTGCRHGALCASRVEHIADAADTSGAGDNRFAGLRPRYGCHSTVGCATPVSPGTGGVCIMIGDAAHCSGDGSWYAKRMTGSVTESPFNSDHIHIPPRRTVARKQNVVDRQRRRARYTECPVIASIRSSEKSAARSDGP